MQPCWGAAAASHNGLCVWCGKLPSMLAWGPKASREQSRGVDPLCCAVLPQALRRVVPGRAVDRGLQRTLWQQLQDAASAILCGGLAGMAMWVTVLPIDVAKTRVQTAWPGAPNDVGMLRQLRLLYAEGAPALPH
jgi:hypothetical protein